MFRRFFGKDTVSQATEPNKDSVVEARIRAIQERKLETDSGEASASKPKLQQRDQAATQGDPLADAKKAALAVTNHLTNSLKDARGVHLETLLCILGSLAGYACQVGVRAEAHKQGLPEKAAFTIVETKDGRTWYFGDALNGILAEGSISVWSFIKMVTDPAGVTSMPELTEIFAHTSKSLGSDSFGIPRIPAQHRPKYQPLEVLQSIWPPIEMIVAAHCQDRTKWPIVFALAIQLIMIQGKDAIDLGLAATMVMECAIPMSKVDLQAVTT